MTLETNDSPGFATVSSPSLAVRRKLQALLIGATGSALQQLALYLVVGGLAFAFCLLVQAFSGTWSSDFLVYPDEPAHFVGSVMVRDWLTSGRWLAPLQFSRSYYDHYPYFALGYWPPLFSIVTGLWMLVTGVGRLQALLISAVFAAGTGWLVFQCARKRVGIVAGICASALYLSLPVVRKVTCAVMVDNMTAFLCIAAAVCLLRYLKQPVLWNGILCAVTCGCAILSKYSAAYLIALPFFAVVILRRFELLRKPSFLVQPFIVGFMVGPWAFWTRKLAFYGLPSEPEALTARHAASFVVKTFGIFPPALMAVVILGLIALLVRPKAWREDLVVLSLLCAGHLAFLILSPVGPDPRYMIAPAAVLLVAAFAGWWEVLAWMYGKRWESVISACVVALSVVFVVVQFKHITRVPQYDIKGVVASIVKDQAQAAQRIVVPPTLEGPVIAEFVVQTRHRPNDYLLRPSKILARADWFGLNYSSAFGTPEEMMEYFRKNPVNLIIWNDGPESMVKAHELIRSEMRAMLQRYPFSWQKVVSLDSTGGSAMSWTIYEYCPSPQKSM